MPLARASLVPALVALGSLAASCGHTGDVAPLDAKTCTTIGCGLEGVEIAFTYREAGTYIFEVTVDGEKTTCRASLPLEPRFSNACDRIDVVLGLIGSALPAEQQSIQNLNVKTTTAEVVHVRATRDGVLLGDKTIRLSYKVTPGPNGPDCEPKECKSATATFP
ncbi:MAG: hypothetical protein KIS78_24785 [Labilithrix sp.]|nr:hypothetical protein [Labilithrix sp.]